MTKVTAIKCPKCKDTVYSRATHDRRECTCRAVAIDGGRSYTKISFNPDIASSPDMVEIEVEVTPGELYRDWNEQIDDYGLIRSKK